ncbi:MAG: PCMD domain-containing protein [Bacteroidales bacterium]|nr:PCMD domain-containing protein [Bacteroidales bacterium]
MPKLFKHIALLALASLLVGSCIENDIPYPLIFGEIIEFEVDGQTGEAQIDATARTISIEVADSVDLTQLRVSRFSINPEAKAPIQKGDIVSCVDSLPIVLETYQLYRWVLHAKQPFTPSVRLRGQIDEAQFDGDTIRVSVSSVSQTAIEELRLAPGNPVYTPALDDIDDFSQTVEIRVNSYGRTKRYVLVVKRGGDITIPSIEQFEVEGQLGEAQIDVKQRSISIEVSESTDLQQLRLAKLTLSEADATASVAVGDEISCVDSLLFSVFDVDGEEYPWKLYTKQQYTPVVRLKGQLGNFTINNDTIRVIVDNMAAARVEELRLAPGKPTYSPDPFGIADFTHPVDIDVSSYGKTHRYTLVVIECSGSVISVRTKQAEPSYTTATLWASIECCEAVQPYFEYRQQGETDWQSTAPGHIEAGAWDYTATLDALSMGTTYEYRAVAGSKTGSVLTFDTKPDPVISISTGAAEPSYTTCTLRASIECREAVQCYFEYRPESATNWLSTTPSPMDAGTGEYTATIDGLSMGTTYEYRAVAKSAVSQHQGNEQTFSTTPNPVESISTDAATPSLRTAELNGSISCREDVQVHFEHRQKGNDGVWQRTAAANIAAANAAPFAATISGLQPETTYEYRAVATSNVGEHHGNVMELTTESQITSISTGAADPWAKFAHVSAEVECREAVPMGFEYRQQGSPTWTQTATQMGAVGINAYTITITALQPNTTYEYRAVAIRNVGEKYGATLTFRTEAAPTVPNLGFNDWCSEETPGNYLWNDPYLYWKPWADGHEEFWQTKNRWLHVDRAAIQRRPSNVQRDNDAKQGAYAAKMVTAPYQGEGLGAIDWGGVFPGCIFTGTIEKLGNVGDEWKNVKLGRPYTGRPTTLSGWYKYSPVTINKTNNKHPKGKEHMGNPDTALIYIYLLDWSARTDKFLNDGETPAANEIVAFGEFMPSGTTSTYTQFNIKLNYSKTNVKPTHIIIYATSSRYGHWLTGGEGSTLWIDEFELGFDYVAP